MKKYVLIPVLILSLCLGTVSIASAGDCAPIAESFEFETYRGVAFGGELQALDPDGDTLSFEITTQPVKGSIKLNDDGSFVYTPEEGKKGRDYFGYRAVDCDGNRSQEATVIIRLKKCDTAIRYADLKGDAAEYSAVRLAESGAFIGKCLGGSYYFEPEHSVSRGEVLSLCLEVTDTELLSGVIATGFEDDPSIPIYLKPYVSTAVLDGIISGESDGDGTVFGASDELSRAEAMVLLSNALHLSDVSHVSVPEEVPAWAAQSAANLSSCGIVYSLDSSSDTLTRAEAAKMLAAAMDR